MKKILVTDDNVSFIKQISVLLENSYEVFLAKSGSMALKIGAQERPDLILLDVEMPEMDGFQTLEKIKQESWFNDTPVIFITGNKDEETKSKCIASGAKDIICKPVTRDSLHGCIEQYIK